jgi:hypothetical protein
MRPYVIGLFVFFASPWVMADWKTLSTDRPSGYEQYIDLEKVKQSGPMAIYRQVQVLSQAKAVAANSALSTLALYEYDCMNTKVRLLEISGFSRQWAEGQPVPVAAPSAHAQWLPLSAQMLGQKIFDLICPYGKDD